jgi:hypothetical protein
LREFREEIIVIYLKYKINGVFRRKAIDSRQTWPRQVYVVGRLHEL